MQEGRRSRFGDKRVRLLVRLGVIIVAVGALTGCSAGCEQLPDDARVTGQDESEQTWGGKQAETAVNVSNVGSKQIITVTYNDGTDVADKIDYTPTMRTVNAGATLLGWSYSVDAGKSWKYGGSVSPPTGWAVLWGDPAITSDFADQRYVFISNLAVPSSKMPPGGITEGLGPHIGGACIARSADGGISFKIHQCVTNHSHIYDGSTMVAAGQRDDRRVFAAFLDTETDRVDVWASPSDTGVFKLMPDPFPKRTMASHPRLRFDRARDALYVAALDSQGQVYINRYTSGWGTPKVATLPLASAVPVVQLADRELRTEAPFSFDVGVSSENGDDSVRVVYTVKDQETQKLYIRGAYCDAELTHCADAPEWGTTPGNFALKGQQFSPKIRAFKSFGHPGVWKVTYMSTDDDPDGNMVSYKEGDFAVFPNGARVFIPLNLVKRQLVCPDERGFWGDYDEIQVLRFDEDSNEPLFVFAHSDSTQGCESRWQYTSRHLHVSAVVFK
jgi:hypothetical protein